jgi:hypothetical protein
MKRVGVPESTQDAASRLPGAPPNPEHATPPAHPPAVPARFWKGVVVGLGLTFAIAYGVYRLL